MMPVCIGVSGVAAAGAAALLVLRVNRRAASGSAAASLPEQPRQTDLLEEQEMADYAAAAHILEERRAKAAVPPPAPAAADIDWSETGEPYRPLPVQVPELLSQLRIAKDPGLEHSKHHVFISSAALGQITSHLGSNTSVELGGLLAGKPFYAPALDSYLVVVQEAYPADGGKETAISFEYTAETWRLMTPRLQEMPAEYVVVGSYHSHPGLGVFLSSTDLDTQVGVFSQEWQIALVIDPVRDETGFFISTQGVPIGFTTFTAQPA